MGEQDKLIERLKSVRVGSAKWTNALNRLLDAARTEGRGEGQPVAWAYEYTNHLKGDRAPGGWLRAVAFEAPTRARVNAGFARNVQPLYASPIREPEISRTILGDPCTLEACPTGLFVADAYNTLGMKTEYHTDKGAVEAYIVESGEFFWGDNPQTVERQRAQIVRPISHADAILNLAPVGGRGERWRPIETAPKDGTAFMVWAGGYEWPEVVRWEAYSAEDAEEIGEPGYWTYAESLMADATDDCGSKHWTAWQPLPPPPQEQGGMK